MYFIFCHLFILPVCSLCVCCAYTDLVSCVILIRCTLTSPLTSPHTHPHKHISWCSFSAQCEYVMNETRRKRDDDENSLVRCPSSVYFSLLIHTESTSSSHHYFLVYWWWRSSRTRNPFLHQKMVRLFFMFIAPVIGQVKRVWKFNFQCFCLGPQAMRFGTSI